jgi:hypothetical protein
LIAEEVAKVFLPTSVTNYRRCANLLPIDFSPVPGADAHSTANNDNASSDDAEALYDRHVASGRRLDVVPSLGFASATFTPAE